MAGRMDVWMVGGTDAGVDGWAGWMNASMGAWRMPRRADVTPHSGIRAESGMKCEKCDRVVSTSTVTSTQRGAKHAGVQFPLHALFI